MARIADDIADGDVSVSVIVPSYRTPPDLLARCLDGIVGQRPADADGRVEAVVVFDGDPDPQAVAVTERPYGMPVRAVVQDHAGVGAARNRGIDEARGRWLMFVDADDVLPDGAVESLARFGGSHACAIVMGDYDVRMGGGSERHRYRSEAACYEGGDLDGFRRDVLDPDLGVGTVWGKLYDARFIARHGLRFDTSLVYAEDTAFVFQACLAARRVGYVPDVVYGYVRNETSVVRAFRSDYAERMTGSVSAVLRMLERDGGDGGTDGGRERRAGVAQDFALYHLCLILVNHVCNPRAPWSARERRREYRRVLAMPLYADALREWRGGGFSGAKTVALWSMKLRWYALGRLIGWIRQRQFRR